MKNYHQLSPEERETIYRLLQAGTSQNDIGKVIGRDKATISRELTRNQHHKLNEYLPDTAQRKAEKRKKAGRKRRYVERWPELRTIIQCRLRQGWTPEQIAGWCRKHGYRHLTKESIYQYIYSIEGRQLNLRQWLPRSHRIRHKRHGRKHQRGKIPNRVDISLRAASVERRRVFGHWEGDSIIYPLGQKVVASQVERKTRYLEVFRVGSKEADVRSAAIIEHFGRLPAVARKTFTVDNGLEFADHGTITTALGTKVFFAKPYASWQRGTMEYHNGLVRRFLPRSADISTINYEQMKFIQDRINNIPRKGLGYSTPHELYQRELRKIDPF